ncbi:hypothetical protein ID866_4065 [Astraeus odoratus]|nr:hypothetical protein ID866_4065 [Astraeus odoratus]
MSAHRSSVISPLRDRPPSNTPDPVQSSIIRESALGWSKSPPPPSSGNGTTPLRIAKREGKPPFPLVARRSSSSYKHLRNNNLVSKSPFKAQLPPPSTSDTAFPVPTPRRVSGEKRPRPDSMHEQAENEHPFGFKRERKQSKAYQGLIEKEPVTKSPFKRPADTKAEEEHPPPLPPKSTVAAPPAPAPAPARPLTPSRPSLVSKRLHGPRTADQSSIDSKRRRRKTVTFDERCDVLEFDRDEEEEDPFFSSDEDDYGDPEPADDEEGGADPQDHSPSEKPQEDANHDSFESIQLGEGDQSITGIVNAMLQSASSGPGLGLPSTPSRNSSLPSDVETEDGVPYGRTHHAERARRRASVSSPAISAPGFPFHSPQSGQDSPSTPRSGEGSIALSEPNLPHGYSLRTECTNDGHVRGQLDEDVNMIPPSPSPAKPATRSEHSCRDSLIPRLELPLPKSKDLPGGSESSASTTDIFAVPRTTGEVHVSESSFTSFEDPMDPANLSIGQSEVSLSNVDLEAELREVLHGHCPVNGDGAPKLSEIIPRNPPFTTSTPPPPTPPLSFAGISSGSSYVSPHTERDSSPGLHNLSASRMSPVPNSSITAHFSPPRSVSPSGVTLQRRSNSPTAFNGRRRSDSPLNHPSRLAIGSPALRSGSPSLHTGSPLREAASAQALQEPRMPRRISREDVHARLLRKRSTESPSGSPAPSPVADPPPVVLANPSSTSSPAHEVNEGNVHSHINRETEQRPVSVSDVVDLSAEFATIETVEKRILNAGSVHSETNGATSEQGKGVVEEATLSAPSSTAEPALPKPSVRPQSSYAMLETSFELGGGLGFGIRDSMGSVQLGEMRSALDRLMDNVKGNSESTPSKVGVRSQIRVEPVTQGVKAGQFDVGAESSGGYGDESMRTETDMSLCVDTSREEAIVHPPKVVPVPMERTATSSATYTAPSFRSPPSAEVPPASSAKDAIRAREELILEKRREARRRDEEESMGYYTPPRPASRPSSAGRPSRRRSRSTGDAGALTKSDMLLDIGISDSEDHLADSISRELRIKLDPEGRHEKYRIREHEAIFASADADQISHNSLAGDVNGGKAWRTVRRPSDMNEYAKQIREYRSQTGKAHGKVFVRVLGVKELHVPIPQQPTVVSCTLNNGIHFVTTPEARLSRDTRIEQEFELIEHNKLEFTLTLKVRRDPHIVAQFKALVPPPPPPQPAPVPKPKSGMFSFLSSSPKKTSRATPPPPVVPTKLPDNLARLIFPGGQEIFFFADTDEEKAKWLEVLRALVGHIPPYPLWAELIWQRQQEMPKQTQQSYSGNSSRAARIA